MHFKTLLAVTMPEKEISEQSVDPVAKAIAKCLMQEEEREDEIINTKIEEINRNVLAKDPNNILWNYMRERLLKQKNSFSRRLTSIVEDLLEKFYCDTKNPAYLVFEDKTQEIIDEYENGTANVYRLADGRYVSIREYPYYRDFTVIDGIVYQKNVGQIKGYKRTKKAKRMTYFEDYPIKKIFKNINSYVEEWCNPEGIYENEGKYGSFYNPNSVYDWFDIGGRWPYTFLVKETCEDVMEGLTPSVGTFPGEENFLKGYKWVYAARKKDIEWELMREYFVKSATAEYEKRSDKPPTLALWLEREAKNGHVFLGDRQYPVTFCAIFTENEYYDQYNDPASWKEITEDITDEKVEKEEVSFDEVIDSYIANLDDETILVTIDYHI